MGNSLTIQNEYATASNSAPKSLTAGGVVGAERCVLRRLPRATGVWKRFLTAAEVAALAEASGRDRVLVYVLAYCGLRFGEAAGPQVGDVDLPRRRLRVERSVSDVDGHLVVTTPKTHHTREVPVPAFSRPRIGRRRQG
jgi:integrase